MAVQMTFGVIGTQKIVTKPLDVYNRYQSNLKHYSKKSALYFLKRTVIGLLLRFKVKL